MLWNLYSRWAPAGVLFLLCAACCLGPGATARVTHRLDPLGISVDLAASHTGGRAGAGYLFTSGDGSSTIEILPAVPGLPAASRPPAEILPGAMLDVQWSRAASYGGLSGFEWRVVERAPRARTHWIGAVDGPHGLVWIHLSTDTTWVPGPTDGDLGWTTLRDSIRPVS